MAGVARLTLGQLNYWRDRLRRPDLTPGQAAYHRDRDYRAQNVLYGRALMRARSGQPIGEGTARRLELGAQNAANLGFQGPATVEGAQQLSPEQLQAVLEVYRLRYVPYAGGGRYYL